MCLHLNLKRWSFSLLACSPALLFLFHLRTRWVLLTRLFPWGVMLHGSSAACSILLLKIPSSLGASRTVLEISEPLGIEVINNSLTPRFHHFWWLFYDPKPQETLVRHLEMYVLYMVFLLSCVPRLLMLNLFPVH